MRTPRLFRRSDPLADALAIALDAIAAGATLDQALATAPRQADELRPLLEAALRARAIAAPVPDEETRLIARAAVLQAAAARRAPVPVTPHPAVRRSGWMVFAPAVLAAAVFAAVALPLVGALDAGAIPGDWNYGIKRAGERVQLALTTDSTDRRLLRLTFAQRRLSEIEKLSQNGKIDVHAAPVVVSLVHDYTVDISQVQSSVAGAPSVDVSTKQAVDKTTQAAQTVLQPIAQSAPPAVAAPAQTALAFGDKTQQDTDSKPSSAQSAPVARASVEPPALTQTAALAPSAAPTSNPTPAAPAAPAATATAATPPAASPTAAPSSTVVPTPPPTAPPTLPPTVAPPPSATTQLRPDQVLPALTPAPTATSAATPTAEPAAGTAEPSVVAVAPLFGTAAPASASATPAPAAASGTPTPIPASASATFAPPSRTASPTAAPVAPRPAAALTAAPSSTPVALQPGDNTLRYAGVPLPLDVLLAPILPDVVYVSYTDAAGLPHLWYRGTQAPLVGAGNSVFIVRLTQAATLTLP